MLIRTNRFGEGPSIYENPAFLIPMLQNDYGVVQKLVLDGQTIGVVSPSNGRQGTAGWVACASRPRGRAAVCSQAITLIEAAHPDTRRWALDTPSRAAENLRFYRRAGYVAVVDESEPFPGFKLTVFQKICP